MTRRQIMLVFYGTVLGMMLAALDQTFQHLRTRGLGEKLELQEGVFGVDRRTRGPDADEDDPLKPQLAVFDLGDVLELRGEPGHPAQGLALGQIHLAVLQQIVEPVNVQRLTSVYVVLLQVLFICEWSGCVHP